MAKLEFKKINIYGSSVVAAVTPKVHLFKGIFVWNKTTGAYVDAPALGAGGLDANHALTITAIPHADNKIGYEITIPDDLPNGQHDLVFLDNLTYKTGIRIKRQSDGKIVDVTNKDGNSQ